MLRVTPVEATADSLVMITLMEELVRSSTFSTSNIEELEHYAYSSLDATEFHLHNRASPKLHSAILELNDIRLGFLTFGTPAKINFPERDITALGLVLRGQGRVTGGKESVAVAVDRPTLASPHQPLELYYNADLEKIFVDFDSKALTRKLAALLGTPVKHELNFELTRFTSQEMLGGLLELTKMLVQRFGKRRSVISPLALRELEEALIVQLLFTGRHRWSERLLQDPIESSSGMIARIEEFIEANWDSPITMEALSETTGISGRTLYRSFAKARGYSPIAFARKIRFQRAHELLRQPDAATTVIGVSLKCGFSNPGRFALDYRNMFGELPSQTLQAARHRTL